MLVYLCIILATQGEVHEAQRKPLLPSNVWVQESELINTMELSLRGTLVLDKAFLEEHVGAAGSCLESMHCRAFKWSIAAELVGAWEAQPQDMQKDAH
eukprot:1151822-Pelagomonas_calceolata.AAC.2